MAGQQTYFERERSACSWRERAGSGNRMTEKRMRSANILRQWLSAVEKVFAFMDEAVKTGRRRDEFFPTETDGGEGLARSDISWCLCPAEKIPSEESGKFTWCGRTKSSLSACYRRGRDTQSSQGITSCLIRQLPPWSIASNVCCLLDVTPSMSVIVRGNVPRLHTQSGWGILFTTHIDM